MICQNEKDNAELAENAYMAAIQTHLAELMRSPKDIAAIQATGLALGPLLEDWQSAEAAYQQCLADIGGASPPS